MPECDVIQCKKAFHAISDMPATQSCSTDVFDVAIEFQRRFTVLTDKLGSPFLIPNLASIGLAIVHYFNLLHRTIGIESGRISDEFMFANNLIDDEPTTASDSPDLLLVMQDADAARLLDGLALNARQLHGCRCK
jgi:hypothetical protein